MTVLINRATTGRSVVMLHGVLLPLLFVYGILEALLINGGQPYPAGRLFAAAAMVAPLALARRFAAAALLATVAVIVGGTLAGLVPTPSILPLPCYVIGFYAVGANAPRPVAAGAAAAALMAVWAGLAFNPYASDGIDEFIGVSFMAGLPFALGVVVRRRTGEARELARVTAELEAEQALRERRAVDAERARIARELHDIVAHSLSMIAVQSGAATRTAGVDPEAQAKWLDTIGTTARDALAEMRRLVAVLRADDGPAARNPQPGLAQIETLIATANRAGGEVILRITGARRPLSPGLDLAAYRIVQEALTNARKHGGGGVTTVSVDYGPRELRIEIESPLRRGQWAGEAIGTGHGLIGMRERSRLYGGELLVGTDAGRYVVTVSLPIGDSA